MRHLASRGFILFLSFLKMFLFIYRKGKKASKQNIGLDRTRVVQMGACSIFFKIYIPSPESA